MSQLSTPLRLCKHRSECCGSDSWYGGVVARHNENESAKQSTKGLESQYFVDHENRDQRGDEGYQDGDGDADNAVSVLAVPQVHAAPPGVKPDGAIGARKRDGCVQHSVAASRIGDQAPVLQVTQRQFELCRDQFGADLFGKLGRVETL